MSYATVPVEMAGNIKHVSANYTLDRGDTLVTVDASGGNVALTMPDATLSIGIVVRVFRTGAGNIAAVYGDPVLEQTINGGPSLFLPADIYSQMTLVSDGANWLAFTTSPPIV